MQWCILALAPNFNFLADCLALSSVPWWRTYFTFFQVLVFFLFTVFLPLSLSIFQLRLYWITPAPKVLICLFPREFTAHLISLPTVSSSSWLLTFIFFFTSFHKLDHFPWIISFTTTPLNPYLRVFYLLEWNVHEIITGFVCFPIPVKTSILSFRELPFTIPSWRNCQPCCRV